MLTWLCWTLWLDRIFIEFYQDQWRYSAGLHKIPISRRLRWILNCSRALVNRRLTTWGPSFLVLSKVNVEECPYHSGPVYMEKTCPEQKSHSLSWDTLGEPTFHALCSSRKYPYPLTEGTFSVQFDPEMQRAFWMCNVRKLPKRALTSCFVGK